MDTIKVEKKQVKMVAHRGLSGIEKENTNAAFVAAGNRSYYGIETDVHKTKDGKYVTIHDDTTQRVAQKNVNVEETDYNTLRDIILNDINDLPDRSDLKIPSLEEYISICKKYGKKCILELKNHFNENEIKEILNIINTIGYLDNVIFISFDKENLITLRSFIKTQPVQWLTTEFNDKILDVLIKNNFDLDIWHESVTKEIVDILHKNNIKINCWTCDTADAANRLIDCGVDFITSNILE